MQLFILWIIVLYFVKIEYFSHITHFLILPHKQTIENVVNQLLIYQEKTESKEKVDLDRTDW